jgi:hypothetical protein
MSLQTPEKIRKLQKALHAKAKEAPDYRFYLLYDKIYRADILQFAYRYEIGKQRSISSSSCLATGCRYEYQLHS